MRAYTRVRSAGGKPFCKLTEEECQEVKEKERSRTMVAGKVKRTKAVDFVNM